MAKGVPVGIGILVQRKVPDATRVEVLVGLRKGSHGADLWAFPGGGLELGESFATCGLRELEEETGIQQSDMMGCQQLPGVHAFPNIFYKEEGKVDVHTVTVFVGGWLKPSSIYAHPTPPPIPTEPDKCYEFRWVDWDNIPSPLFPALEQLIDAKWQPNMLPE